MNYLFKIKKFSSFNFVSTSSQFLIKYILKLNLPLNNDFLKMGRN